MRAIVAVAVLAAVAGSSRADVVPAGGTVPYAGAVTVEPVAGAPARGLVARAAVVDRRTGTGVAGLTRLHPIVGSVQRGHTNPLTHKATYTSAVYNPILGAVGKYKFRR